MASSVRVDSKLHARLREIAESERRPIGKVIEDAIGQYEREKFWRDVHDSVERLRADPAAWQAYRDEVAVFEGGSMDGLEHEEPYYTPEEEEAIRAEHARTQGR
jgi:predicted transcriptional regulator